MDAAPALVEDHAPVAPAAPAQPAIVRAKILTQDPGAPVQLVLPAKDAEDLAFIAEDFARQVLANDIESDRLVEAAAAISTKLRDCLMARAKV